MIHFPPFPSAAAIAGAGTGKGVSGAGLARSEAAAAALSPHLVPRARRIAPPGMSRVHLARAAFGSAQARRRRLLNDNAYADRRPPPGGNPGCGDRAKRTSLRRRYKIQDVIHRRQVLLVQVVKEERGNKGAALTTYLSAGRPLLRADAQFEPWRRHQPQDQQRGGPQAVEVDHVRLNLPGSMGCIVRTAGPSAHQDRDQARLRLSRPAVGRAFARTR
jgi:Ribonuclease G/E